jgi:hypothetical protein
VPPVTGTTNTLRPLQGNLKITSGGVTSVGMISVCKTIPELGKQVVKREYDASKPLAKVTTKKGNYQSLSGILPYNLPSGIYHTCCETSKSYTYSVQDQKAAGCQNSDALSTCMNKLAARCVSKALESKSFTKAAVQNDIDNLQNAITSLNQLKQSMEKLRQAMP